MVEVRRETFTVTTIGTGHPDYSTPVTQPTERSLTVLFPEREVAGKRYDDFATINFTSVQTEYVLGTNANAAKAGSWPSGVVAKQLRFFATQPCWVRFNDADAVPQFIPATMNPLPFTKRVSKLYVFQHDTPGTLHVWIEG